MKKQPNILFLSTDQHRYDFVGCNGNSVIQTKNIDNLASMGTRYANACTPTPLCVPARMSLITGKRIVETQRAANTIPSENCPEWPTIMSILSRENYWTQGIGKMHFFGRHYGFRDLKTQEECVEYCNSDDYITYLRENKVRTRYPLGFRDLLAYQPQGTSIPREHSPISWVGREACTFLDNHKKYREEQPFFLWVSWIAPHLPMAPCRPFNNMYSSDDMKLPANADRPEESLTCYMKKQRLRLENTHKDPARIKRLKALYSGQVSHVDYEIGNVLEALKTNGFDEDTIIFFFSDHGDMLGDQGLSRKGTPYEGAIHIPLIVRWRGKTSAGSVDETPVDLTDILPTLLKGLEIQHRTDDLCGDNVFGPSIKKRKYSFVDFGEGPSRWVCLRNKNYKYIKFLENGNEELYDLQKDPNESNNLIGDGLSIESEIRADAIKFEKKYGYSNSLQANDWVEYATPKNQTISPIVLNQDKWPENLPEDEQAEIESYSEAFDIAITAEPTVTPDKLSITAYKKAGGNSLMGTAWEKEWIDA